MIDTRSAGRLYIDIDLQAIGIVDYSDLVVCLGDELIMDGVSSVLAPAMID